MSELGGVSAPAVVTSTAGDGGLGGGDKIPMDFGSSPDSERSNPPPPSLLHRGDPEISTCVPCCTCVRACCGPPI